MKKTCAHCGKQFETPSAFARYCSDACRQADYRRRKAEKQPQPAQAGK